MKRIYDDNGDLQNTKDLQEISDFAAPRIEAIFDKFKDFSPRDLGTCLVSKVLMEVSFRILMNRAEHYENNEKRFTRLCIDCQAHQHPNKKQLKKLTKQRHP